MIRFSPSLKPGQGAPDFSLPDSHGRIWRLADFKGRWLVLFFYPADFTPGCTVESCGFRDRYREFKDAGAEVVGVSGDSEESHLAFAKEHNLPFLLLSDSRAAMRRAYTVPQILGRLSGRTSFAIDPDGVIRHLLDSRSRFMAHVSVNLDFVRNAA